MDRQYPSLQLVFLVALMACVCTACGCTSSPWWAKKSPSPALPSPETATSQATASAAPPDAATPQSNPAAEQAALDAMTAEIDQTHVLDSASRGRLLEDLRQTEPRLRPLVIQQFRAAMAYRRQTEQREAALAAAANAGQGMASIRPKSSDWPVAGATQLPNSPPGQVQAAPVPAGVRFVTSETTPSPAGNRNHNSPAPADVRPSEFSPISPLAPASAQVWADENPMKTETGATTGGVSRSTKPQPVVEPVPVFISPAQAPGGQASAACLVSAVTPVATPAPAVVPATASVPAPSPALDPRPGPDRTAPNDRPAATDQPERVEFPSAKPLPGRASNAPSNCVPVTALLPVTPTSEDWRTSVAATIRALESGVPKAPQSADDIAQHARLRMLYLLAGRRDDALRPIPAAPAAMQDVQDFWANELYGLVVWFDSQRITDSRRRAEEAKRHLEKAVARLAEMSPLMVRNLTFVTEIQSFGNYKPCRKTEFAPEEALLLYAEVDNLKSEETPKGYHTAWRSSYRIFDSRGQMVADHQPTASEEYCQNLRQDFFIGCQFRLPKRIYPGKHTLHLTVEDVKSQKTGESSIEFTVKQLAD